MFDEADTQYGHSMAVSPMGEVIGTAEEKEAIVRVTFG